GVADQPRDGSGRKDYSLRIESKNCDAVGRSRGPAPSVGMRPRRRMPEFKRYAVAERERRKRQPLRIESKNCDAVGRSRGPAPSVEEEAARGGMGRVERIGDGAPEEGRAATLDGAGAGRRVGAGDPEGGCRSSNDTLSRSARDGNVSLCACYRRTPHCSLSA